MNGTLFALIVVQGILDFAVLSLVIAAFERIQRIERALDNAKKFFDNHFTIERKVSNHGKNETD